MNQYIQATVTIMALINPAICALMFASIETGRKPQSQAGDATRAMTAMLVILVAAALVGTRLLSAFGISLDAFQVAGGSVLMWMGFSMLTGSGVGFSSRGTGEGAGAGAGADSTTAGSIIPLVMFGASPGTITGVITLSAAHSGSDLPVTALAGSGIAVLLTWLLLLATSRSPGKSAGFGHEITSRLMGLIVLAMGVQFLLTGLQRFFGTS